MWEKRRRLNVLNTLDSVWAIGFEDKISLLREIILELVAVKYETTENRRRVQL